MSIINLLQQIKNKKIVLPAIQRNFVWDELQIEKLFDSLMRGYPIGIVLLWDTYTDIQHRFFECDYVGTNKYTFHYNKDEKQLKLVLDGQQRLQSLYVALHGKYEGKELYLDVLSGQNTGDFKEKKYDFAFMTADEADNENQKSNKLMDTDKKGDLKHYLRVRELLRISSKEKQQLRRKLTKALTLSEDVEDRLSVNIGTLNDVLTKDENVLKVTTLDEGEPPDSRRRLTESDILEAFVRVNVEGTKLNRSDLIFSMLKLSWRESAEALPELVRTVNKGNSFHLNTDFVIRCLFTVSNLGSRFDINVLRKTKNIQKIKKNFERCCDAIRATVDFVQEECWIASSKLLKGGNNLIPFVYYLFHTPKQQIPDGQIDNVRKAVYLFGFTAPFSRYADSRLGRFIREELKPLVTKGNYEFPLQDAVDWVDYWEDIGEYGSQMLQKNARLTHHLVQGRSGVKARHKRYTPELDHIFPRSILRKKGFDASEINHFANFWILGSFKNQKKSNKDPRGYFEGIPKPVRRRAFIDLELLDYSTYKKFLKKREKLILKAIKKKLSLSKNDYSATNYEDE